jgi:gas vesicle protein
MNRREPDSGLVAFGFLVGSVIGGLIALWYAPLSGRALVRRAGEQVEQVQNHLNRAESSLQSGREALLARQRSVRYGSSTDAP